MKESESLTAQVSAEANLSKGDVHQITMGTIAEWLMQCPLDFPPFP